MRKENPVNYQRELERLIKKNQEENRVPRLLLHSCCAPCSSYCLEYLAEYFQITLFYYNPNISPEQEYVKRVEEQRQLVTALNQRVKYPIIMQEGVYDPGYFYEMAKGMEDLPEGGERCFGCYELRLKEAAVQAARDGYDYFTTTLTISPLKNACKLNEIGSRVGQEYGVSYLPSDFKKKNGYKRSLELSREYGLYRQSYCGCIFSKQASEIQMLDESGLKARRIGEVKSL